MIDAFYLRGIESLYTWKILIPERSRSGSYSDILFDTSSNTQPDALSNIPSDIPSDTLSDTLSDAPSDIL